MTFEPTDIKDVWLFRPKVFEDDRGGFFESYNEMVFHAQGIIQKFVQDNQSFSRYGVIRGLHYQLPPYAQAKLVRVLRGKILDVVVDIRVGSPSYGKVFSEVLSARNKKQLYIPTGCAHGFSVLSKKADVLYECDAFYNRESEGGIRFDDPALAIDWKIPRGKEIVSEKDLALPLFKDCRNTFTYEGR
jgi:dTDP-4-dehydrorhamnose 3,5-epimerase